LGVKGASVNINDILKQIDGQIDLWRAARGRSQYDDLSDLNDAETNVVLTRLAATIDRLAPEGSRYKKNAHAALAKYGESNCYNIQLLVGILQALRADYEAGYLKTVEELIHADIFGDFLEMANYLLTEGYKDPAAVIIGGVLEEHIRKLCDKHSISTVTNGRPKKTEALNTELAGAGVLSKLDQKNVTAWLDLRNKSAHGKIYGIHDTTGRVVPPICPGFFNSCPLLSTCRPTLRSTRTPYMPLRGIPVAG
jgi:hypothetical protein